MTLLELIEKRAAAWDAAKEFLEKNITETGLSEENQKKHDKMLEEVSSLSAAIDKLNKQRELEDGIQKPDFNSVPVKNSPSKTDGGNSDEDSKMSKIDRVRGGREYFNAFVNAIASGANIKTAGGNPAYAPLYNALTETGGTPEGADGGFLVPIDIDNAINELKRQFLDLSGYFTNESVNTLTGWRVFDTAPTKGFTKIDEMGNIPQDDQPKFSKISYSVSKYGLIVPMSNELLADNAANLTAYIARWFARKEVITKNNIVLNLLKTLTPVSVAAGKEVEAVKTALNVTLDPEISKGAKILTNQSGFNLLDLLIDETGKPLMQPDVTNPTAYRLKGREIIVVADANLPNTDGKLPMFIGDYKQFATLFTRKPFEMASTNIGGNAWATDSVEVRGIMRLDARIFDSKAVTYLQMIGEE